MSTPAIANNNELAPDWITVGLQSLTGYTNSTYITFSDLGLDIDYAGWLGLNLPAGTDGNNNGTPDFFEVSRAVNAATTGYYSITNVGSGSASAQWVRDAGSGFGTLSVRLNGFVPAKTFNHTFELLEFIGPLSYTPGTTDVNGTIDLLPNANSGVEMGGPIGFAKISTNKYNLLSVLNGSWTNTWGQNLIFTNHLYSRDLSRPTNYSGFFEFFDYDPFTLDDDYWWWRMIITDPNDNDHDGIPDFSDDAAVSTLPRRPTLSLVRTSTNLLLKIAGDVGHVHQIQEKTALSNATWSTISSVTLTNDPQTVALPAPSGVSRFWRVQAL